MKKQTNEISTGRWDIDHIINDDKDLIGLILLYFGRANDIQDTLHIRREHEPEKLEFYRGKMEAYREVAREIEQALKVVEWQTSYRKASDMSKGFLDD